MSEKTSLADIYKAAGATVTDDGMIMAESLKSLQPFDIVLKVMPQGLSIERNRSPVMELAVVLREEVKMDGNYVEFIDHAFTIELPVDQIRIFEEK